MRVAVSAGLLSLIALMGHHALAAEPTTLRVLSYNIHHGEGVDGKLDLERIANVIRSVSPDVVALQEVDRVTERTQRVDQPAELARLTGLTAVFEKNIDLQGGEYGNAVLTKLPIQSHRNHPLPQLVEGEKRGALAVEVTCGGQPLTILGTHFDHRPEPGDRIASAKQLNQWATDHADQAALLIGDLNATPDSEPLRLLKEQWRDTAAQPLPTIPVGKPSRQIDFILVRPADRWRTVEIRVLDETVASDHRPIFAVLELRPAP
ncbi:MAG: endonuclease/exonuclease/phosphatase family protein [Planctomycetaceae bacterium]|nr:endonuclease/exonuclease/phosphatase family protein [Planctomycetaceae bacterium]